MYQKVQMVKAVSGRPKSSSPLGGSEMVTSRRDTSQRMLGIWA